FFLQKGELSRVVRRGKIVLGYGQSRGKPNDDVGSNSLFASRRNLRQRKKRCACAITVVRDDPTTLIHVGLRRKPYSTMLPKRLPHLSGCKRFTFFSVRFGCHRTHG